MLIVDAVLETPDTSGSSFWPVADLPSCRFMVLSGRMSPREVGTALVALAGCGSWTSSGDRPVTDAGEPIRRLLEADGVVAPGGLRFHDTATGVTVDPGCCCGLESWREWSGVTNGDIPWLGHDPSPRIEHAAGVVRLWPDGADAHEAPSGRPVEIAAGDLPGILRGVQESLTGFLLLTGQWATRHVPALAEDLVAVLDEELAVGAPLPSAGGTHVP
ncbi:hypothetical protein [Streptomyces sp. NPDC093094]|uniref:hypothetical protein n=1 Tax=Streptomyces sp. NPDC093094 TaxID=3366026 RepID=UPI0038196A28